MRGFESNDLFALKKRSLKVYLGMRANDFLFCLKFISNYKKLYQIA